MGIECVPSEPMNVVKQSSVTYTAGKDIQTDMNVQNLPKFNQKMYILSGFKLQVEISTLKIC